jgi:hypothetical protein
MGIKWNKKMYLDKINKALMTPAVNPATGMAGTTGQPNVIQMLKDKAQSMMKPKTPPTGMV